MRVPMRAMYPRVVSKSNVDSPYIFTPWQFNLLMTISFAVLPVICEHEFYFLLVVVIVTPFFTRSTCKPMWRVALTVVSILKIAALVMMSVFLSIVSFWFRYT